MLRSRRSPVGSRREPEQIVEQITAYAEAGVSEIHTTVSADPAFGVQDQVGGMELFLREVWPLYRARYTWRPRNARSFVWSSASSDTGTRGPNMPSARSISSGMAVMEPSIRWT